MNLEYELMAIEAIASEIYSEHRDELTQSEAEKFFYGVNYLKGAVADGDPSQALQSLVDELGQDRKMIPVEYLLNKVVDQLTK